MVKIDNYSHLPLRKCDLRKYMLQYYRQDITKLSKCSKSANDLWPIVLSSDLRFPSNYTAALANCCSATLSGNADPEEVLQAVEYARTSSHINKSQSTSLCNIVKIYRNSLIHLGVLHSPKMRYMKGVGFSAVDIYNIVDSYPIMLYVHSDNRFYYHEKIMAVVGISIFIKDSKMFPFIAVYDDYSKEPRYIDYNRMSLRSSIIY